jgi:hypothetical protein
VQANEAPGLYQLTDYHWLLLYESLRGFSGLHNDLARDAGAPVEVGPYLLGEIDFGALLDLYFWDLGFLLEGELVAAMTPEQRKQMGMNPELFGLSQGLVPHPKELKIELVEDEEPEPSEARVPPEGSIIRKYPYYDEGTEENCGVVSEPGPPKAVSRVAKSASRRRPCRPRGSSASGPARASSG